MPHLKTAIIETFSYKIIANGEMFGGRVKYRVSGEAISADTVAPEIGF